MRKRKGETAVEINNRNYTSAAREQVKVSMNKSRRNGDGDKRST